MSSFGKRLSIARKNKGYSQEQLAIILGVTQMAISYWESGSRTPDISTIHKIIKILDINGNYLFDLPNYEEKELPVNAIAVRKIPILGSVAAGNPLMVEDDIIGWTYTTLNGSHDYFALYIKGDSMNSVGLDDGDLAIVEVTPTVDNGSVAVIKVNTDDATVKKFYRISDEIVQLMPVSTNPIHQPQIYNLKDTEITVTGKVVKVEKEIK